jgi:tetratricopeptide (TPR) repeat protein
MERAFDDFDRAVQMAPNLADVFLNRGSFYMNLGRFEEALTDFGEAILIDPTAAAYTAQAAAYTFLGERDLALESIDVALRLDPSFARALELQSSLLQNSQDYAVGTVSTNETENSSINDPRLLFERAVIHFRAGDIDAAEADLSQSINLDPENVEWYVRRGELYSMTDQLDKAEADFEKAMEIDPVRTEALMRGEPTSP